MSRRSVCSMRRERKEKTTQWRLSLQLVTDLNGNKFSLSHTGAIDFPLLFFISCVKILFFCRKTFFGVEVEVEKKGKVVTH